MVLFRLCGFFMLIYVNVLSHCLIAVIERVDTAYYCPTATIMDGNPHQNGPIACKLFRDLNLALLLSLNLIIDMQMSAMAWKISSTSKADCRGRRNRIFQRPYVTVLTMLNSRCLYDDRMEMSGLKFYSVHKDILRNGEYPAKVIWKCQRFQNAHTGEQFVDAFFLCRFYHQMDNFAIPKHFLKRNHFL